jgi:hypothetical protein
MSLKYYTLVTIYFINYKNNIHIFGLGQNMKT